MYVVTRVFQAGVSLENYDHSRLEPVIKSLKRILASEEVAGLIVVTNTEPNNHLAEIPDQNGKSPTQSILEEKLPDSRISFVSCVEWGKNPGSANAVSDGCKVAIAKGAKLVMVWSPELQVTPSHITRALSFMESRHLEVVGFHREGWYEKLQYHVFQNTGAIYRSEVLQANEFFAKDCDGLEGRTVNVVGFGEVPLAGMDDFHFLLRHLKSAGKVRWGMVCRDTPLPWQTNFEPGSQRALQHAQKVARQEAVMYQYIKDLFGGNETSIVLSRIFAGMQMD